MLVVELRVIVATRVVIVDVVRFGFFATITVIVSIAVITSILIVVDFFYDPFFSIVPRSSPLRRLPRSPPPLRSPHFGWLLYRSRPSRPNQS